MERHVLPRPALLVCLPHCLDPRHVLLVCLPHCLWPKARPSGLLAWLSWPKARPSGLLASLSWEESTSIASSSSISKSNTGPVKKWYEGVVKSYSMKEWSRATVWLWAGQFYKWVSFLVFSNFLTNWICFESSFLKQYFMETVCKKNIVIYMQIHILNLCVTVIFKSMELWINTWCGFVFSPVQLNHWTQFRGWQCWNIQFKSL